MGTYRQNLATHNKRPQIDNIAQVKIKTNNEMIKNSF